MRDFWVHVNDARNLVGVLRCPYLGRPHMQMKNVLFLVIPARVVRGWKSLEKPYLRYFSRLRSRDVINSPRGAI